MKNARKKSIAVLAGLSVAGLVGASAATLGGIGTDNLGADAAVIASCDSNGVTVAYGIVGQEVDSVTIGDVAAGCAGQNAAVTLFDSGGGVLGSGSVPNITLGGTLNDEFTVGGLSADAEAAESISIVITGATP